MTLVRFHPLSDKQLEELNKPFEVGLCKAEIVSAIVKLSENNNEMIQVKINATDKNGTTRQITSSLVFTDKAMYKVKNFCEAFNITDNYKKGIIETVQLPHKIANAMIVKKTGIRQDGSPIEYLSVDNWAPLYEKAASNTKPVKSADNEFNDDIPFG
jgi:hypothetical protein